MVRNPAATQCQQRARAFVGGTLIALSGCPPALAFGLFLTDVAAQREAGRAKIKRAIATADLTRYTADMKTGAA